MGNARGAEMTKHPHPNKRGDIQGCPKCGVSGYYYCTNPEPYEGYWAYGCGSRTYPNGTYQQSDKCRICELEAKLERAYAEMDALNRREGEA